MYPGARGPPRGVGPPPGGMSAPPLGGPPGGGVVPLHTSNVVGGGTVPGRWGGGGGGGAGGSSAGTGTVPQQAQQQGAGGGAIGSMPSLGETKDGVAGGGGGVGGAGGMIDLGPGAVGVGGVGGVEGVGGVGGAGPGGMAGGGMGQGAGGLEVTVTNGAGGGTSGPIWMVVHDKILDVTHFNHPGHPDAIPTFGGFDATEPFEVSSRTSSVLFPLLRLISPPRKSTYHMVCVSQKQLVSHHVSWAPRCTHVNAYTHNTQHTNTHTQQAVGHAYAADYVNRLLVSSLVLPSEGTCAIIAQSSQLHTRGRHSGGERAREGAHGGLCAGIASSRAARLVMAPPRFACNVVSSCCRVIFTEDSNVLAYHMQDNSQQ